MNFIKSMVAAGLVAASALAFADAGCATAAGG